jgi:heme-degrading monooxygenase HmoA
VHVRIAKFRIPPGGWDGVVQEVNEEVVPAIREVPGFVAGFFVGDRDDEVSCGIVFWESKEAMFASEEAAARIRTDASAGAGLEFTGVERFEVMAFESRLPAKG